MAWKIRQDERVVVMERTNFRYSKPTDFLEGLPQVATIDVSFISLSLILPPLYEILVADGDVMALIKPQFEAGKEFVGKHGIVKDPKVHQAVIEKVIDLSLETGFSVENLSFSPITGGEGNIEFLIHLKKASLPASVSSNVDVTEVVRQAHERLEK